MNVKLSALALGLTLAYGMTAAMADEAVIDQSGGLNDAVIEQYNNDGSQVRASISTSGWNNDHSIEQTRSSRAWADINSPGSFNTATVLQSNLDYGGTEIYQGASGSTASVDQGADSGWGYGGRSRDGSSQWAFIYQNWGYGHDASVVQRGDKVEATIVQTGIGNSADVSQRGTGRSFNIADVTQSGIGQTAAVTQNGHGLTATVTQSGMGHYAMVNMRGSSHTATVTQSGFANSARVMQRN